jgi:hypothetical protein
MQQKVGSEAHHELAMCIELSASNSWAMKARLRDALAR